ncbi:MAG: MAPEG family protein [Cyanobacteria bacterium J06635_11]
MTPELFWLTLSIAVTALFWTPYVVNRMLEKGIGGTLANPTYGESATAAWAERMSHAHTNAVENLVIFAPLVVIAAIAGISTPVTIAACQLYFFARLAHFVVYSLGIPFLRTVTFIAGFVAQMTLAIALLSNAG